MRFLVMTAYITRVRFLPQRRPPSSLLLPTSVFF